MLKIGLTGGIGSGKSTVAKLFEQLKVPVYYSDERAKWLINNHSEIIKEIKESFGVQSYVDGNYNIPYIKSIVFKDKKKLEVLNNIVHPRVREDFSNWIIQNASAKYVLDEAAILFETGIYKKFDKNIIVTAPKDIRIERVSNRDGVNKEAVLERINMQWDDEKKIPLADFVINNDGEKMLIPQILEIHKNILNEAI